jgi:hypothetical protein
LALPLLQRLCGEREAPGGFGVDPRGELAVGAAPVGEAGLEAQRALFGQPDRAAAGVRSAAAISIRPEAGFRVALPIISGR